MNEYKAFGNRGIHLSEPPYGLSLIIFYLFTFKIQIVLTFSFKQDFLKNIYSENTELFL